MPEITFQTILLLIQKYGYLVIFFGSFIEGISIMLLGGFLVSIGVLNGWVTISLLFLGDFASDVSWYFFGYYGGSRIVGRVARRFGFNGKLEKAKVFLEERGGRIIIPVKFTSGFCWAMIVTAGTVRMDFRKFLKYNIIGNIGWVAFTFSLGLFFGRSFGVVSRYVQEVGFTLALIVILAFVLVKVVQFVVVNYLNLEKR